MRIARPLRTGATAVALAALLGLSLASAVWPAFVLLVVAVAALAVLALARPALAFTAYVLLFAAEGLAKALLDRGLLPTAHSPISVAAALLDVAFAVVTLGLLAASRAELRSLWRRLDRLGRAAAYLLGGWLVLSLIQIPQSGHLHQGLMGFRLTQGYVPAVLAGAALAAGRRAERRARGLLRVSAAVAGYAAFRALAGPSELERNFALSRRTGVTEYGHVFRTVGSFSGSVGLVSFLVPAAAFGLLLALLSSRQRVLGAVTFACATAGIVGSYSRAALVGVAVGVAVGGLVAYSRARLSRRRIVTVLATVGAVLLATAAATAIAGRVSPTLRSRERVFLHPLGDPSVRARLDDWRHSARIVERHPLGTGVGTVGRATAVGSRVVTTDNSLIKIFREQGIPGGLLFLAGIAAACIAIARAARRAASARAALAVAALGGSAAFLAIGLSGEYVEQPGKVLAWTLLGLAAGFAYAGEPVPEEPLPRTSAQRVRVAAAIALVALLVVPPVGLSLFRERSFSTAFDVTTIGHTDVPPPPRAARYVRFLLTDGALRQYVVTRAGLSIDDRALPRYLKIEAVGAGQVRVTAHADTPDRAHALAEAFRDSLPRAGRRQLQARIERRLRRARRALERAGPSGPDRRVLAARIRSLQVLRGSRPEQLAVGPPGERARPARALDRLVDALPGPLPPDPPPLYAALGGVLLSLLLGAIARDAELRRAFAERRRRRPETPPPPSAR